MAGMDLLLKGNFDNVEALELLTDEQRIDIFNLLEKGAGVQDRVNNSVDVIADGKDLIESNFADVLNDEESNYTPRELGEYENDPDVIAKGPKINTVLGKSLWHAAEMKAVVDKMAEENPFFSAEDGISSASDLVIAGAVNDDLSNLQEGISADQQLQVGRHLFSGSKADMMNLMIHVGDSMEDPANKEGLFERMVEISEYQAADNVNYATPELSYMQSLNDRDDVTSAEKFDLMAASAQQSGYYNPFGEGHLTRGSDGEIVRRYDIGLARDADQLPLASAEVKDGVATLEIGDAGRQLFNDFHWAQMDGQFEGSADRRAAGDIFTDPMGQHAIVEVIADTRKATLLVNEADENVYVDINITPGMDAYERSLATLGGIVDSANKAGVDTSKLEDVITRARENHPRSFEESTQDYEKMYNEWEADTDNPLPEEDYSAGLD